MPIYQYRCSACGALQEVLAKMSDPAPDRCASCGAEGALQKQISRTSFALKGGGWYREGYAGTSNQAPASSGGGEGSSSGASSGSGGAE